MAFGKLAEGLRLQDFVSQVTLVTKLFLEAIQDQLAGMLGPLPQNLLWSASLTGAWAWKITGDYRYVDQASGGSANEEVWFEVPLREGQRITGITVIVLGDSATVSGGSIKLRRKKRVKVESVNDNVYADVIDIGGANPYKTSVTRYVKPIVDTTAHTIAAGYTYVIEVLSGTDASNPHGIVDVVITSQMGN